jgi:hypothetical protein
MLAGPYTSGVAVGSNGNATNSQDTPTRLVGKVLGIYVDYLHSPPNTTDVVISTKGTYPAAPSTTLITLTNKNADGWFYPRVVPSDTVGADLATLTVLEPFEIDDVVNIFIDDANAADYAECWFLLGGG